MVIKKQLLIMKQPIYNKQLELKGQLCALGSMFICSGKKRLILLSYMLTEHSKNNSLAL